MSRKPVRPSLQKRLLIASPFLLLILIVAWSVISSNQPPLRGEIVFKDPRPTISKIPLGKTKRSRLSFDWVHDSIDELKTWEKNPWKSEPNSFGNHYFELQRSHNPADQVEAAQIRERAHTLYLRVLARYPEFAVSYKNIPPEENGFLKFLDFHERMEDLGSADLHFSPELRSLTDNETAWDPKLFRTWRKKNQALLEELLAIGLTQEQSIKGIDVGRYHFFSGTTAMNGADALLLNARLSLDEGNTSAALQSVRAARGLAEHFSGIETPTLLGATIHILINMSISNYTFNELIPAIPKGQFQPSAWEAAVRPKVAPPAEFGRFMLGEWHVTSQTYFFPILADSNDPKYPSDPAALIDYQASNQLRTIQSYSGTAPTDWPSAAHPKLSSDAHLSRNSRKIAEDFSMASTSNWSKGFLRTTHQNGMNQAAFAIMKGEPIPTDPVYGYPYQWDPATRLLSPPNTPEFADQNLGPITVPQAP